MEEKYTVFVCSCDAYEDLWAPFFTLYKRMFWGGDNPPILLNTETKTFQDNELNILSYPQKKAEPYGKRMRRNLKQVKTPYVLLLMDDFFLRKKVDHAEIEKVIGYMDNDPRAAVFSFHLFNDELNTPSDKYKGYVKRPMYGPYKYNFQAAVWRTEFLLKSWRNFESPWEWEMIGNFRSGSQPYDFYCIQKDDQTPMEYGFNPNGFGVFRGKWVVDSVDELFKEHGILVDYSKRGIYGVGDTIPKMDKKGNTWLSVESRKLKSWGGFLYAKIGLWRVGQKIRQVCGKPHESSYIKYVREKEQSKRR